MTKSFEETDQTRLGFTTVCEKGHCDPLGNNVKFKYRAGLAGICAACSKGMPDGVYTKIFEYIYTNQRIKKTPEQRAAGAVQASMRWNARNKDKTSKYIQKYQAKPETQAHRKEVLDNLPEEEKERRRIRDGNKSKAWYNNNVRNAPPEKKAEYREKWRVAFQSLSEEEKERRRIRDREYKAKKKQKSLQQKGEDKDGNH